MPAPKAKTYTVLNPREIPEGIHILSNKDRSVLWYEGDTVTTPAQMPDEDALNLVEQGFLEVA